MRTTGSVTTRSRRARDSHSGQKHAHDCADYGRRHHDDTIGTNAFLFLVIVVAVVVQEDRRPIAEGGELKGVRRL